MEIHGGDLMRMWGRDRRDVKRQRGGRGAGEGRYDGAQHSTTILTSLLWYVGSWPDGLHRYHALDW